MEEGAVPAVQRTKTHRQENFPVASLLIARELRAPVLAFYAFVREADDIADSPDLGPSEKLRRLDAMEAALAQGGRGCSSSDALARAAVQRPEAAEQARVMLEAFRQDATKRRYADWNELLAYCERSANPVGRFLLRLHGEDDRAVPCSDALCTALQILNHLQDLVPDRERLDRIYMPVPWIALAGGETAFFTKERSPQRRAVLDAALDRTSFLLDQAEALVARLKSRRLAAESAVTIALARRLSARLRKTDPVLQRVELSKTDFASAFALGAWRAVRQKDRDEAVARAVVARSGSSFKMGMSSLSREGRRAIHAVYAFCREIDDIADGAMPLEEKRRALALWRREIDHLGEDCATPIGRELAWASRRFDLPNSELRALLDGMEFDAAETVRCADDAALELYCRRVAGAVGVLSVRIFGVPEAVDFAVGLGRTLQLVNILRDIDEDAANDRVYVPLSRLRLSAAEMPAAELVGRPDFTLACKQLSIAAAEGFDAADRALQSLDRNRLRPAIVMMEAYRALFERLRARGWAERGDRARLTKADKLRLAWLAFGPKRPALSNGIR